MRRPLLSEILFEPSYGYGTGRVLVGAGYVILGPLAFLGWPPDLPHRWWTLIPLVVLGVALYLTWRNMKRRHYTEHPLSLSADDPPVPPSAR